MRYDKIIFLILLCLCISIGTVSAENINSNITSDENSLEMNFNDLNNIIQTANSNDVITLEKNVTLNYKSSNEETTYENGILINKNLTINGKNHVINACDFNNNHVRIFNVTSHTSLTLNNIILTGASSEVGSAILFKSEEALILNNVSFINNNAQGIGGAITLINGELIQTNVTYINNKAINGGAIFGLENTKITENNAYYIHNSASSGGAIFSSSNIKSYNSIYENNNADDGGAILLDSGEAYYENLVLYNNIANSGSTISLIGDSSTYINKSKILNNSVQNFGALYLNSARIIINNTLFNNSMANESAADIYGTNAEITIINSNFTNSIAKESAGSIGLKKNGYLNLDNCIFNNTIALKDGGAIYSDGMEIKINNCIFENNFAEFGGAIVILETNLFINNSLFKENIAIVNAGAVHVAFSNAIINNTIFESNGANQGGAIYNNYNDKDTNQKTTIINTTFINNFAEFGGGIYSISGSIELIKDEFKNNKADNGSALYTKIDNSLILNNTNFNNDTITLNNTSIYYVVIGEANPLTLINNSITLYNLPYRFNLRDFGWLTPVRNQGSMGACWTFSALGSLESALLKATNVSYTFSNNNMQNLMIKYSEIGTLITNEAGGVTMSAGYLVGWLGPLINETESYDQLGKLSGPYGKTEIHIQDIYMIPIRKNATDNDLIKWALIKYGAVDSTINFIQENYNATNGAYYYSGPTTINHAISIVGWDDNYSRYNFLTTPPGDGAFIIKNSYGTEFGDNGFNYVSYYDTSLARLLPANAYIINNTVNYNKNYQYDITGLSGYLSNNNSEIYYLNNYQSIGNDLIAGVGTYFPDFVNNYKVQIYVNNELKLTQNGTTYHPGFSTIKLNYYIPLKKGDNFTAIISSLQAPCMINENGNPERLLNTSLIVSRLSLKEGNSFYSYDGKTWFDFKKMQNATACLKVYTVPSSILSEDIVKYFRNGTQFKSTILNNKSEVLQESKVGILINGVLYNKTTDKNGVATLNINLNPGVYNITVFNYETGENRTTTVTILSILTKNNDIVKYFRNGTQYSVKALDEHGNPIINKNVTFNINGIFYRKTTDENGIATLNINLNPGKYIITVLYNGQSISNNITILKTIETKDISMTNSNRIPFKTLVLDGKGNPLAGAEITFNINGIFYHQITNKNGIATLNINLNPGKYIITSSYNHLNVSNKITITN